MAIPGPAGRMLALQRLRRKLSRPDLTMAEMTEKFHKRGGTTTGKILRTVVRGGGSLALSAYAGATVYGNYLQLGDIGRALAELPVAVPKDSLICEEVCPMYIKMYAQQVDPEEDDLWIPPTEDTDRTVMVRDVVRKFVRNCKQNEYDKH
uniref:Uncharacterized protein n=1 Tax=Corethron hystrix TaxID=216773 RepID=A0A7S1FMS3_9STRA|mmetsp:Transcript_14579/g.32131  ORF Transcript_14579/g.32131 Transcript_14579/m.32131 type:complete len:150 (+) Transcript_14579:438-887(+)